MLPGFGLVPGGWGLTLTVTYLAQALVSHLLERRFEPGDDALAVLDDLVSAGLLDDQLRHHCRRVCRAR